MRIEVEVLLDLVDVVVPEAHAECSAGDNHEFETQGAVEKAAEFCGAHEACGFPVGA